MHTRPCFTLLQLYPWDDFESGYYSKMLVGLQNAHSYANAARYTGFFSLEVACYCATPFLAIISWAVDFIENVSMGIKLNHIWSTFWAQKILPKLSHFVANGRQNSLNRRPISLGHEFCLYSGLSVLIIRMYYDLVLIANWDRN